jgi:hypothetical protein
MFLKIDNERATLFVQQVANGHEDADMYVTGPDGSFITYGDRLAYLDKSESNLKANLPPAVVNKILADINEGDTA